MLHNLLLAQAQIVYSMVNFQWQANVYEPQVICERIWEKGPLRA